MEYTIRIEKDTESGWLCGQCEELPEAVTQGKDMDELLFMMDDAIKLVLECKRDEYRAHCNKKNTIVRKLRYSNEAKTTIGTSDRKRVCAV